MLQYQRLCRIVADAKGMIKLFREPTGWGLHVVVPAETHARPSGMACVFGDLEDLDTHASWLLPWALARTKSASTEDIGS